jgi:hypothetical protein
MRIPCSRTTFENGVIWCNGVSHSWRLLTIELSTSPSYLQILCMPSLGGILLNSNAILKSLSFDHGVHVFGTI